MEKEREENKLLYKYINELYNYIKFDKTGTIILDYNNFKHHIIKIVENPTDSFKLWKECTEKSSYNNKSGRLFNDIFNKNIENALINVIYPLQKIDNIREKIENNEDNILSNTLRNLWFYIKH